MAVEVAITPETLGSAHAHDARLISYDIEMTEVTGGTFWKPYTPEQIAGTEEFPRAELPTDGSVDMAELLGDTSKLMAWRDPINLANPRLRTLARALGPSWVRVSGSWATNTYYDFDGHTGGQVPKPYQAVLTRAQWEGVLDFVRSVGGKLLVSFAVIPGLGNEACCELGGTGAWDPAQVRLLLDTAATYGVSVSAVEFCNEPNISFMGATGSDGSPYAPAGYAADQDAFFRLMRTEYPNVLLVGPCGAMDPVSPTVAASPLAAAMGAHLVTSAQLINAAHERPDVFSYHIYAGISERGAAFGHHWDADEAASDAALAVADDARRYYEPLRDAWCPGAPLWVTESGDANCGGNTWGSTFLDVLRTADEFARFSTAANGAIFHNTLASSDYGLLDEGDFSPRPNWWLLWLWRTLVGAGAFELPAKTVGSAHVYAFSRADRRGGAVLVAVNNSQVDEMRIDMPAPCERFVLSSADAPAFGFVTTAQLRSKGALLNGAPLELGEGDALPDVRPLAVRQPAGTVTLQPGTVAFLRTARGLGPSRIQLRRSHVR